MISICIPIYDFEVVSLVRNLLQQADAAGIEVEVVLFDDDSPNEEIVRLNQELRGLDGRVRYLPLVENLGRSRIRNRMADYAQGEWLLFMDCDMRPSDDLYLSRYHQNISDSVDLLYGGVFLESKPKDPDFRLQWLVETDRMRDLERLRQRGIYEAVSTGNFMVRRSLYERVRFDETLNGYGREDQLFSLNLRDVKARILKINNPTVHQGKELNQEYLRKIEESLVNLVCVWNANQSHQITLRRSSNRIAMARMFDRVGLSLIVLSLYGLFSGPMRRAAARGRCPMFILNLYQMGFLLRAMRTPNLSTIIPGGRVRVREAAVSPA